MCILCVLLEEGGEKGVVYQIGLTIVISTYQWVLFLVPRTITIFHEGGNMLKKFSPCCLWQLVPIS